MKRYELIGKIANAAVPRLRRTEERMGLDEWASYFDPNNTNPLLATHSYSGKSETLPNNYEGYINSAYKSSGVVFAVCMARSLIFSEVKFMYQKMDNGRPTDLVGGPDLSILENPWPNGTTGELLMRAMQDVDLCGNHYAVEEGYGPSRRLRRLRPDWVSILLSAPPDEAVRSDVVAYVFRPGNTHDTTKWETYPIDGSNGIIVHWSPYPDPEAQYRGMSWMTPVMREIMTDKASTQHKLKFFENAATPNLAVSFNEDVSAEQFKEFKKEMEETHGGMDSAYKTLYLGGGANVEVVGSTIQQMEFKSVQGMSETRIAAAGGVHPAIVGLSEGLQSSSGLNNTSYPAIKDRFDTGTLRPLWRSLCAAYEPLVNVRPGTRLWYDTRDIAFLRDDQKKLAEIRQLNSSVLASLITSGYTPESSAQFIVTDDPKVLQHTGLVSVQLLPPGTVADSTKPDPNGTDAKADPKGPANTPASKAKATATKPPKG